MIDSNFPWHQDFRHAVLNDGCLRRIQKTLDHWRTQHGFTVATLPWMAPDAFMAATRPDFVDPSIPDIGTEEGALVCSAEQAFLWLHAQGALPEAKNGRYIGWTPCFRRERYGPARHHYFLKAELFVLTEKGASQDKVSFPTGLRRVRDRHQTRDELIDETQAWWTLLAAGEGAVAPKVSRILPDKHGVVDLEAHVPGIGPLELGSYGTRKCPNSNQWYTFGTALAEPRWGMAYGL
jgi:hypothetical protein